MNEQYAQIDVDRQRRYVVGAPIIWEAWALLKDNATGEVFAQLKFKSISDKSIKAITISLECHDVMGNEVQRVEGFQYLDLDIRRNRRGGQNVPVPLPDKTTRNFALVDATIVFADGSIWTSEDVVWEELPGKETLASGLGNPELCNQYQREVMHDATICPMEYEDLWVCACGAENHTYEDLCHICNTPKTKVFSAFDVEALRRHREEYEREQAEEEAARRAERQEKREQNISKLKKNKIKIILAVVVTIAAIVALVSFIVVSCGASNTSKNNLPKDNHSFRPNTFSSSSSSSEDVPTLPESAPTLSAYTVTGELLRGKVVQDADGYVLADSSVREYSRGELEALNLTPAELCIAWNEPFAREGYHFKNPDIQAYFESTSWYRNRHAQVSLTGAAAANNALLREIADTTGDGYKWKDLATE